MPTVLRMPELATDTPEATLMSWPLPEGQRFARGDTLFVVETAKAAVDVAAEAAGVLVKTLVAEGIEVAVGTPIAVLAAPHETVTDLDSLLAALDADRPSSAEPDASARAREAARTAEAAPAGEAAPAPDDARAAQRNGGASGRVFASPLARRQAREAGLQLAAIAASGPNGRITRRDVEAAIAAARTAEPAPAAAAVPDATPVAGERPYHDVPHTRLRRTIAARMVVSKQTAPHFYLRGSARVDRLLALRADLNAAGPVKVSVNDLIVKAVAAAHRRTPALNVIWTADAVRLFDVVDIAVAVATPSGLVTPVVRDVDRLGMATVAETTRDLAERARAGRLQQRELDGGTITVTNLGMYGTVEFAAIINPPQAAILAVGAAAPEPVVTANGKVRAATVVHLTLSVDHRPVDGTIAAQWLAGLVDMLEHPTGILL
jgi:pyruvate dehydrogenase E2 component (dihydrolipoamide acetyltransferase)